MHDRGRRGLHGPKGGHIPIRSPFGPCLRPGACPIERAAGRRRMVVGERMVPLIAHGHPQAPRPSPRRMAVGDGAQLLRGGWLGRISTRLKRAWLGERSRSSTTSATSAGRSAQSAFCAVPRPNSVATLPGITYETRMPS